MAEQFSRSDINDVLRALAKGVRHLDEGRKVDVPHLLSEAIACIEYQRAVIDAQSERKRERQARLAHIVKLLTEEAAN